MDYDEFCEEILVLCGCILTAYKRNQMERRTRAYATRLGLPSLAALYVRLRDQPAALAAFLDYVTINVSEFFRDPEVFTRLSEEVLPTARIWSAGCAHGAEAYTLSMLLDILDPAGSARILATDIDQRSLARAHAGVYHEAEIGQVPPTLRDRYFRAVPDGHRIDPRLAARIDFRRHDLLTEDFPGEMDLILCRNVVIYFTAEVKERLFAQFFQALRPGGHLLLGTTERILPTRTHGFTSPWPHCYRRDS